MLAVAILATNADGSPVRIGLIEILNDRTGTLEFGNYQVRYTSDQNLEMADAEVKGHDRKTGVFPLIQKAINALQENSPDIGISREIKWGQQTGRIKSDS